MKKVVILILVIAAIVALFLGNNHRQEQRLYNKMQGYLNVDWQNSAMERSSDYSLPLVLQPISIEGDSISLPLLMMKNDTINNDIITDQELDCIGSGRLLVVSLTQYKFLFLGIHLVESMKSYSKKSILVISIIS